MRREKARRLAHALLPYLTDGRPVGCKCLPNPGYNTLPCDNVHLTTNKHCPLNAVAQ